MSGDGPKERHSFHKDVFALGKVWSSSDGTYKARVHTFVRNDIDIPWIQEKICKAVIERTIGKIGLPDSEDYAQTWKHILPRVGLLSLETVQRELDQGRDNYARVEDLPNGAILSLYKISGAVGLTLIGVTSDACFASFCSP